MKKSILIFVLSIMYSNSLFAADESNLLSLFEGTQAEKTMETSSSEENGKDSFFSFLNFSSEPKQDAKITAADKARLSPLEQTKKLADGGDLASQLLLGYSYLYGENGANIDYDKSFEYYAMAALQNDPVGLNNLGSLYYSGIGIKRNSLKAAILFEKSADMGNAEAAVNLGFILISGNGHAKDPQLAMNYFEMAANTGNPTAQYMLGYAHYRGILRPRDYKKAAKLIKSAAEAGIDDAQYIMAQMYIQGIGVPQNYGNAVKYLQKSAEQGNGISMVALGDILFRGEKFEKDLYTAHVLFNIASVYGVSGADKRRSSVESKLKIDELLRAQSEAEKFEPKVHRLTSYIKSTFGDNIASYIDEAR